MGTCKWQQTLNWSTLVMMSGSKLFHSDLKRVIKSSRKWLLQVIADKDGSISEGIIECTTVTMATVFGLWEELEEPKKAHENSKQRPELTRILETSWCEVKVPTLHDLASRSLVENTSNFSCFWHSHHYFFFFLTCNCNSNAQSTQNILQSETLRSE